LRRFFRIFIPGIPARATVRIVDIPGWFAWIALGLAALQAFGLVSAVCRLRGSDPATRAKARIDLGDSLGSLLLVSGLMLTLLVATPWFWLTLAGLALLAVVYTVQGAHWLRARRRPIA
jgi:hypothetical protein